MAKIKAEELCPCGSGKIFGECHGPAVSRGGPDKISKHVSLIVISEPDPNTRAVFQMKGEGTIIFQGQSSEISFDCGQCGAQLAIGLQEQQLQNVVLQCAHCKAFNEPNIVETSTKDPLETVPQNRFQSRTFLREQIRLDFSNFDNCRFIQCEMIFSGYGPVTLSNCSFDGVQWRFLDAAANTMSFLTGVAHGAGDGGKRLVEEFFSSIISPKD